MNKYLASVLIVVGAFTFSLVFVKQIRVSKERLANYFAATDYGPYQSAAIAGTSITNPAAKSDSAAQIQKDVDGFNFTALDENNRRLEEAISELE